MKAKEIEPIISYLIAVYFENNGGIKDFEKKGVYFYCFDKEERIKVMFDWVDGITKFGTESKRGEYFYFGEDEKITNLEAYVWETLDRILKVEYYDERPREDDPTLQ